MKKLSPISERVIYLIDTLADGSQRQFASKVQCSHSVIAKIVQGKQEPGPKILSLIGQLRDVNKSWLLQGTGEPIRSDRGFHVPIASTLLAKMPQNNSSALTGQHVELPASFKSSSLYAVEARVCQAVCNDSTERLLPEDLLVINADQNRWLKNLNALDGMLCVFSLPKQSSAIYMQRVWKRVTASGKKQELVTVSNQSFGSWVEGKRQFEKLVEQRGRPPRHLDLGNKSQEKIKSEIIPLQSILGLVVRQIRSPRPVGSPF